MGENYKGGIQNCYATATVTGNHHVGGLVGRNYKGVIGASYATGTVIRSGSNSYYVGGLVGDNYDGGISSSYYYIYSTLNNGYGIALDDAQLQDQSSFVGFDFSGIWTIEVDYMPRFNWQTSPGFEPPYLLDDITTTLSGTGYSDDPFIIASYDDLMEFRNNPELRIGCYSLTCDIDLTSSIPYPEAFIPEGFQGSFAGNGHVISNLVINGESDLGFFSRIYGVVNNLGLKNVSVTGSGREIGTLAGWNSYGSISDCYAIGEVNGFNFAGGLVGSTSSGSRIHNSYAISAVNGDEGIGGLVGRNAGSITKSYATGTVTGSGDEIGGIVGRNSYGSITESYVTGTVTGYGSDSDFIGGLIGKNLYSNVVDCYATGMVMGSGDDVGGLVGENWGGIIRNCYAKGAVVGNYNVGGLVGDNPTGSIINSFWDIESSCQTVSAGGTGKTTDQMQTKTTFTDAGWDFSTPLWRMLREHEDYLRLAWQEIFAGDIAGLYGVNMIDFAYLANYWGLDNCDNPTDCGRADIDTSGDVGLGDLAAITQDWLKGI